ncbi:hypothetical protein BDB00DRAFT_867160 [Zychaea mexicana]|uniref:uncharacterized protein n=1 Tax=Zychaea mexicana TaxID=64656 RepID=UPI0022FF06B1|nr:uncharacterized protein BDB00DRAFT_867160 [Zychaea mexicana]KAI9499092.1 hypothetical protein BDB00DRAFT_867160 [Zychaea mexicana]
MDGQKFHSARGIEYKEIVLDGRRLDNARVIDYRNCGPELDKVVSVENCLYYMSLLQSFYEVEQSLEPEIFKLYVVAAERRYLEFIRQRQMDTTRVFIRDQPIPLDIAYAWHAHLLSPYRYRDDIEYRNYSNHVFKDLKWEHNFPLKAMYEAKKSKLYNYRTPLDDFFVYPRNLDRTYLKQTRVDRIKAQNYYSSSTDIRGADEISHARQALYIRCASCSTKIYVQSWEDYAAFRMNPSVALKCPALTCQYPDNTIESLAVANILESVPYNIKGLQLNSKGSHNSNAKAVHKKLCQEILLQKDKFRGSKNIEMVLDLINHHGDAKYKINGSNGVSGFDSSHEQGGNEQLQYVKENEAIVTSDAEGFINVIRSTYKNNPTSFSLDLIQAMHQQREFVATMNQKTEQLLLPTWMIDLAWHIHMLHPARYFRFMQNQRFSRVPNHDDTIAPSQLKEHVLATETAWSEVPSSLVPRLSISLTGLKGGIAHTFSKKAAHKVRKYPVLKSKLFEKSNINKSITLADVSYHRKECRSESVSNSNTVRELIFDTVAHTGYGYIGSFLDDISPAKEVVRRFIGKRCFSSEDVEFMKYLKPEDKNHEWWIARYNTYGVMRRKYSKRRQKWGWTTDGVDWYSEEECEFIPNPPGKFEGALFYPEDMYLNYKAYSGYSHRSRTDGSRSESEARALFIKSALESFYGCSNPGFSADSGGGGSSSCGGGGGGGGDSSGGGGGDSSGGGGGDSGGGGGGGGGGE